MTDKAEDKQSIEDIDDFKLTPRQERFCHEYIIDKNGTQAAIRASYSPDSAAQQASTLLTYHKIKYKINQLIKERLDSLKIDADFILRSLLDSATVDIADAYDENGNIKPISEMPEPLRKAIVAIETEEIIEYEEGKKVNVGTAKKIKLESRHKALNLLGKHLKMFTDVTEVKGLEGLAEAIKAGRERAKKATSPTEEQPAPKKEE